MNWNGNIIPEHHIEHVFTCGGTPYFRFTDAFSIPCERAMDAIHVYQEFKNHTDDEFLMLHCLAKKKLYEANPIKLFEIKKLDDQLEERLNMALPPPRLIEALATVLYFDESENPYKYDRAHAEKKKKKWREETITGVDGITKAYDFFLLQPLKDLIPSLELQESEIQNYLTITQMIDKEHLKTIFTSLSLKHQNHSLFKSHWFTNDLEKMSA